MKAAKAAKAAKATKATKATKTAPKADAKASADVRDAAERRPATASDEEADTDA